MRDRRPSFLATLFRKRPDVSTTQWFIDKITANWGAIAGLVGGGAVTYLAKLTSWLQAWGPVVWGTIGVGTALVVWLMTSLALNIRAAGIARIARAELDRALSRDIDKISPLDTAFDGKIIKITDLYIPYMPSLPGRRFRNCHLIGPGMLAPLDRTSFVNSNFHECMFIVVEGESLIKGVTGLGNAYFDGCEFVSVTFIVNISIARMMRTKLSIPREAFAGYPID